VSHTPDFPGMRHGHAWQSVLTVPGFDEHPGAPSFSVGTAQREKTKQPPSPRLLLFLRKL
jgi:hypothetical protein